MPKIQPTRAEFEKRLLTIQGWMIDGAPSTLIIQQIILKTWAKSERHAYILLQKAREKWIKYEDDNVAEKRKMKVQELKNRIRGMNNEYKGTPVGMRTILAYEKEIIRLEGLYFLPPPNPKHSNGPIDTSPIEINNLINISNENTANSDIDYTLLPDDVLMAIVNAKKKEAV